jgi:uncharacterized membrane protein YdcZ (DUF606 family)
LILFSSIEAGADAPAFFVDASVIQRLIVFHVHTILNFKFFMKKIIGIVLILIGIAAFAFSGFSFTTKEKVVDVGPIAINKDKKHNVNWPPIAGVVLAVGGIVLLLSDRK